METNRSQAPFERNQTILAAAGYSRYLQRLIEADGELLASLDLNTTWSAERMQDFLTERRFADETGLWTALRRLRQAVMAGLIVRDLAGLATLEEVVATVTTLAETAVSTATAWLYRDLADVFGRPVGEDSGTTQQLHAVGMGKLGGSELNASSDIDLIFLYPEDGETDGPRSLSNHEFFTRMGRRLIAALNEWTADGLVFRVDTRLRPYGDSGPLVCSFDMLENYFITQGRAWERYAWIKARALTGDQTESLQAIARPFVYRKHLDYGAFESLRELHAQIRAEVRRKDRADDIKLGPGGIREIEFIAQVFQLIRGGHDPALRTPATLSVLALLAEKNLITAHAADELSSAYRFLRNLEHRLQYRDDKQTQRLPGDPAEQELLAQSMRFPDQATFSAELDMHRTAVTRHFNAIFSQPENADDENVFTGLWQSQIEGEEALQMLAAAGFSRGADILRRLQQLRQHRYRQMPAASQRRLDQLIPLALQKAGTRDGTAADDCAERLLNLFEAISRREAYLSLLLEYPQALDRVVDLMQASAWVADYITQRPLLLDQLLDARTLMAPPDWTSLRVELRRLLDSEDGDTERQMDALRHFKHAQTLHLIAQDLGGQLTLEKLSDHLSELAETVLSEVLRLCWQGLRQRHRETPCFAIIGYGKLGGKELGYASDLDIVFVYDDSAAEAAEIYARLAQRINLWLTSTTAAGQLYDTDLRLRPDGAGGLLVTSLESLRRYQESQAWVWEHQALTRARAVIGDAGVCRSFEQLRIDILTRPRETPALRHAVAEMREKMREAHPNQSGDFDIKHDDGGIVDVEFMVQFLILAHAHRYRELTANSGNLALLRTAATLGLLEPALAESLRDAYRRYRQWQHRLRLGGGRYARVPAGTLETERAAVKHAWGELLEPQN
jgi:glutamate-ammonia-ligase adenylyltransferase